MFNLAEAKKAVVPWNDLALAESTDKKNQQKVKELEGRQLTMVGYMVPLEVTDMQNTTEFLLIPALPICMHVKPPPPSETVRVKLKKGRPLTPDPIWVVGKLTRKENNIGAYGASSYEMEDPQVDNIKEEESDEVAKLLPPPQKFTLDCNGRDRLDPVCAGQKSIRADKKNKSLGN